MSSGRWAVVKKVLSPLPLVLTSGVAVVLYACVRGPVGFLELLTPVRRAPEHEGLARTSWESEPGAGGLFPRFLSAPRERVSVAGCSFQSNLTCNVRRVTELGGRYVMIAMYGGVTELGGKYDAHARINTKTDVNLSLVASLRWERDNAPIVRSADAFIHSWSQLYADTLEQPYHPTVAVFESDADYDYAVRRTTACCARVYIQAGLNVFVHGQSVTSHCTLPVKNNSFIRLCLSHPSGCLVENTHKVGMGCRR